MVRSEPLDQGVDRLGRAALWDARGLRHEAAVALGSARHPELGPDPDLDPASVQVDADHVDSLSLTFKEAKLISLRRRFYLRQTSLPCPSASNSPCGACRWQGARERSHVPLEGWAKGPVVERRRRVIERKERCSRRRLPRLPLERCAVSLRNLRLRGECAECVPPERRDDDRLQEGELALKEPCTGGDLRGLRVTVLWRATLDDIEDIDLRSLKADEVQEEVEQLASGADKGASGGVLVRPWRLTNKQELGVGTPLAWDALRSLTPERTGATGLNLYGKRGERRSSLVRHAARFPRGVGPVRAARRSAPHLLLHPCARCR